jgi:hypothetical protein
MKQYKSNGDPEFTMAFGFGGKSSSYWTRNKKNLENGMEYVGITKIPYQNLMLDRRILRTKKKHAW